MWRSEPGIYLEKRLLRGGTAKAWNCSTSQNNKAARMIREGDCDFRDGDNKMQNIESPVGIFQDWNTWYEIGTGEFWQRAYMIWLPSKDLFLLYFHLTENLPGNKLLGLSHSPYKLWSHSCPKLYHHVGALWFVVFNGWDFHLPVIFSISQYLYIP